MTASIAKSRLIEIIRIDRENVPVWRWVKVGDRLCLGWLWGGAVSISWCSKPSLFYPRYRWERRR